VTLFGLFRMTQEFLRSRSDLQTRVREPATTTPASAVKEEATKGTTSPQKKAAAAKESAVIPAPASKAMRLQIRVTERAMVVLHPPGQPGATYQMRAGDEVKVEANEAATLFTDNAGAVHVKLNGKHLPPLGKGGEPRQVVLTPVGIDESRSVDFGALNQMRFGRPGEGGLFWRVARGSGDVATGQRASDEETESLGD
jgi:hypothetical protein